MTFTFSPTLYFGHFYIYGVPFYSTYACSAYCIDSHGNIIWKTTNLGIDGIIIEQFIENEIHGRGEWNPPSDWIEFTLDLDSGKKIERRVKSIQFLFTLIPISSRKNRETAHLINHPA